MQEMYEVLAELKNEKNKNSNGKTAIAYNNNENCIEEDTLTILIAEDNEVNMYLNKILVAQLAPNSEIVEAKDGVEAVRLFFEKKPDFVLMDIQMPNMNGYEATVQIRLKEKETRTPIVALTAGNMSGEKEKCLQAGMDDFMAKPIVKKDLAAMFSKWLKTSGCVECGSTAYSPTVEHLNKDWFRQYATDDFEFKGKFVQLAKVGIEESIKALQEGIIKKDLEALNATGHKLKGTSLAVGLTQLSKLAVAFEFVKEFDEEYVQNLFESVQFEAKLVSELLDNE